MQQTPSTSALTTECKLKLCREFTLKIFHARINEYFSASEELHVHLERLGKAVMVEQGLWDTLVQLSLDLINAYHVKIILLCIVCTDCFISVSCFWISVFAHISLSCKCSKCGRMVIRGQITTCYELKTTKHWLHSTAIDMQRGDQVSWMSS